MGSLFPIQQSSTWRLFLLVYSLAIWATNGQSQIIPPPPPKAILPPPSEEYWQDQDLKRMQQQRRGRERLLAPPPPNPAEVRNKELFAEALQEREMDFMFQVSLLFPYIKTTGQRSNYTAEPTSHFHAFFKMAKSPSEGNITTWWGLRAAPFAGTGIDKKVPGRYGFTYFGPMIGMGKISPGIRSSGHNSGERGLLEEIEFPVRYGWFWMSGIAASTNTTRIDPSTKPTDQDFSGKGGIRFDSPGIWTEITYTTVHFGALGVNFSMGAQLARQKIFYYGGIAAAGWN